MYMQVVGPTKPIPTPIIIQQFALSLITLHGSTTSLEVKEALRTAGFWAKQADVSEALMDLVTNDLDEYRVIYANVNGKYRTYSFAEPLIPIVEEDDALTGSLSTFAATDGLGNGFSYVNSQNAGGNQATYDPLAHGNIFLTDSGERDHDRTDRIPANYQVTDRRGGQLRSYTNVSRGQAKSRWSKDTGRPLFNARTTKVTF